MRASTLLSSTLLAVTAQAQSAAWGQCGGTSWTGATSCVSGYVCSKQNDYYSQCVPGSATTTSITVTRATSTFSTSTVTRSVSTSASSAQTTSSAASSATGLAFLGVNESGGEFGNNVVPGAWGTNFIFPSESSINTLVSQGYNIFRVAFLMERMAQGSMSNSLDAAYLANFTSIVNYITDKGAYAILDPHNFGRYNGAIISDTTAFGTFWKNLATAFKSNTRVIFDTNNEYHDMDQTLVLNLNQAAINAIRSAGATSQTIYVEGNSYSGAWTWASVNDNLKALTDPNNKIVYEMHQYLDSDGSGTSDVCVSSTIGAERVASATAWLRANGKKGIIGEFAGGANTQCQSAVKGLLDHLSANSDVWTGALWWGGGPWWGTYIFSFEPPSGIGYTYYNSLLRQY